MLLDYLNSMQAGFIRVLRVVSIIAAGHLANGPEHSNVWSNSIWDRGPLRDLKCEVGKMADTTFVQLSLPQPSRDWYIKLLGARDVLFDLWISHPLVHTSTSTSILVLICNTLAMLDLRN